MTKTRHMIASAPIAIAAMAALHTTAATAQETPAIVLDIPAPAASPAPAPTPVASPAPAVISTPTPVPIAIELPEVEPMVEPPVVNEAEPVATTQTTRAAAPQPRAAIQDDPTGAPTSTDPATSNATSAVPSAAPIAEEAAAATETELAPIPEPVEDTSSAALLLALLGVGGIGLAAFMLFRSRRRRRREDQVPEIERPVVAGAVARDHERPALEDDVEPLRTVQPDPTLPLDVADAGNAPVVLPAEKPRDPAERDRLLRRMIDAKPDRANPFVSHKARAKRARLILQSIGTRFTDRKPGIDLSQYTNVWPELRGWRPATT